jgi:hypothetical protein
VHLRRLDAPYARWPRNSKPASTSAAWRSGAMNALVAMNTCAPGRRACAANLPHSTKNRRKRSRSRPSSAVNRGSGARTCPSNDGGQWHARSLRRACVGVGPGIVNFSSDGRSVPSRYSANHRSRPVEDSGHVTCRRKCGHCLSVAFQPTSMACCFRAPTCAPCLDHLAPTPAHARAKYSENQATESQDQREGKERNPQPYFASDSTTAR